MQMSLGVGGLLAANGCQSSRKNTSHRPVLGGGVALFALPRQFSPSNESSRNNMSRFAGGTWKNVSSLGCVLDEFTEPPFANLQSLEFGKQLANLSFGICFDLGGTPVHFGYSIVHSVPIVAGFKLLAQW